MNHATYLARRAKSVPPPVRTCTPDHPCSLTHVDIQSLIDTHGARKLTHCANGHSWWQDADLTEIQQRERAEAQAMRRQNFHRSRGMAS